MSGTEQAAPASEVGSGVPALEASNLSKTFGAHRALKNVDLKIDHAEVVALLGENGSGKSTLVKILSGYHEPEPGGGLRMNGVDVPLPVPLGRARTVGLSFVYQDLGLAPDLQVVENLFVGQRVTSGLGSAARINWRVEREHAREIFKRYEVELDPSAQVGRLRPTSQALLAIVRAAYELREYRAQNQGAGGVLVLDEPTVFLPEHEKVFLFDLVRRITSEGFGVLFVSHDMTAVREIADRAVVLRDGAKVGDVTVKDASDADLIELVSGHRLDRATIDQATTYGSSETGADATGDVVMSVRDVRGGRVRGMTFDLHAGEILGIAGLLGAGSEDLPYVLFGNMAGSSGEISIGDWSGGVSELAPSRSIKRGVALVPADRKQQAAVADLPVSLNLLSLSLKNFTQGGFLRLNKLLAVANERTETYDVRPRDASLNMSALSGGNQQKVVLGRWLEQSPRVLLLHEPTQGVDVATRYQIYELMRARAAQGVAILWVSTDFDEIATVSHRILLCAHGVIAGSMAPPYSRDRITSEVYSATARGGAREVTVQS
ncbi:MAG TPA: sugar ABC transporter ATP-binding protein [Solirubrobacteraceae bacterium]|jgi:ribose transport system ATP-binding protein|nr:sugar ABC transporter ATP-binding protein [Solirubrobacteraceae bacterium]